MLLIKLIDERLKTLKGKQWLSKEILKSYDMKKIIYNPLLVIIVHPCFGYKIHFDVTIPSSTQKYSNFESMIYNWFDL